MRATQEVMVQVQDGPVSLGDGEQLTAPVDVMEVCVILGLTGDLEGRVIFEFGAADALSIVGAMNYGETFTTMDSLARATLCELGNLVAGRALTLFNDQGGNMSLSPPMLLCGLGLRTDDQNPVLRFQVRTGSGNFYINLSTRQRRNK